MMSYRSPETLVPANHPMRAIRPLLNAAIERLSGKFDEAYSVFGEDVPEFVSSRISPKAAGLRPATPRRSAAIAVVAGGMGNTRKCHDGPRLRSVQGAGRRLRARCSRNWASGSCPKPDIEHAAPIGLNRFEETARPHVRFLTGWLASHCAGQRGFLAGASLSSAQVDEP
jgi:hypothetical protein